MIANFYKVNNNLYRGGNLYPKDVIWLKQNLGITKIVSLDEGVAKRIDKITKLLNIEHVKLPLILDSHIHHTIASLINLLSYNFYNLLQGDDIVFVGCIHGKDRTGLVIALFQIKYMGISPKNALKDAKQLGFGVGLSSYSRNLFTKLILKCKPVANINKDINSADIVSNERDYGGDYRNHFLDEARMSSFSPYLSETRQYPYDNVYPDINDQSPTRENYQEYKHPIKSDKEEHSVPLVGQYNNNAGIAGAGPTINSGGFIYD
jgi:hypothetical protein